MTNFSNSKLDRNRRRWTFQWTSRAAVNTTLGQTVSARPAVSSFDMVFFDIHSGARYLVKFGQITKPLERMRGEPGEAFSENGVGYRAVSKSVYLGSRED